MKGIFKYSYIFMTQVPIMLKIGKWRSRDLARDSWDAKIAF